jgi:hypothetical protein
MPAGQELAQVKLITPILEVINKGLAQLFKKKLPEINKNLSRCIEAGVKGDDRLKEGNANAEDGRKVIKFSNEVRLSFTRPIDAAKKEIMREFESMMYETIESTKKLDGMVMARHKEIRQEELRIKREHEAAAAAAEEAARKREETNRKISLGLGGTGDVAPVIPDIPAKPIATIGMRDTVKTRSIVDKEKIEQAVKDGTREIPGVDIFQVWTYEIADASVVPDKYRKSVRR